jgi:hypothetical protein
MKYLITIAAITLFFSCVKDETEDPVVDYTREYFPLETGHSITYAIDSIVFDDALTGNKKDTVSFFIREETGAYEINGNDTIYYIRRYRKDDPLDNWRIADVWTSRYNMQEALRTEENLTFRKLLFPLREGRRWIATSYIHPLTTVLIGTENVQAYQEWEAEIEAFDVPDQIGSFTFSGNDIMHVIQTDTDDGLTKRYVMEKYARNIGLVQRIDTILDSKCLDLPDQSPCIGRPIIEHASKGYILSQVMIDHN